MLRCSFVPAWLLIVLSFYGITSIQAFLYFQRPKEQSDGWKYAVLVRLHAILRIYVDLTSQRLGRRSMVRAFRGA